MEGLRLLRHFILVWKNLLIQILFKKAYSVKTEEISKEEYEKLAKAFINENDILIFN